MDEYKENLKAQIEVINNLFSKCLKYYENNIAKYNQDKFKEYIKNDTNYEKNMNYSAEELLSKLSSIIKTFNDFYVDIETNWENFNESYRQFINNRVIMTNEIINVFNIDLENERNNMIYRLSSFILELDEIELRENREILSYFAKNHQNYIIFGKNGAGKTKLLKYIREKSYSTNSYVLPANRIVDFGNSSINNHTLSTKNLGNLFEIRSISDPFPNDLLKHLLSNKNVDELIHNKIKQNNGINYGETLDTLINIFNSLGLERNIRLADDNISLQLYSNEKNIAPYDISQGSDGEKSIVAIIIFLLLIPKNSFVFIDEPERHLNTALAIELFDLLEKSRNDLTFIYCTHDVDFIESRVDCDLVYIANYDGNNKWNIKTMDSFENIPVEIIVNIIGTKKDILFVEGTKNSLDYNLYSLLFPEFKIIPVESCTQVINICKSINFESKILKRNAYGIVDNDYRSSNEITELLSKRIHVLKYNEIENMFLSPYILKMISEKTVIIDHVECEKIKKNIVEITYKKKGDILKDYAIKTYNKSIVKNKFNNYSLNSIKNEIQNNYVEISERFEKEYIKFKEKLEEYIKNENYDEIIKNVSYKGFVTALSGANISFEKFKKIVIEYLKQNDNECRKLRNDLFDF